MKTEDTPRFSCICAANAISCALPRAASAEKAFDTFFAGILFRGTVLSPFGLRRRLPPLRRRRRGAPSPSRRQLILSIFGQFVSCSLLRGRLARRTRLLRLLMRSLALFRCILFGCGSGSILLILALAAFLGHSGGILTVAARALYRASTACTGTRSASAPDCGPGCTPARCRAASGWKSPCRGLPAYRPRCPDAA